MNKWNTWQRSFLMREFFNENNYDVRLMSREWNPWRRKFVTIEFDLFPLNMMEIAINFLFGNLLWCSISRSFEPPTSCSQELSYTVVSKYRTVTNIFLAIIPTFYQQPTNGSKPLSSFRFISSSTFATNLSGVKFTMAQCYCSIRSEEEKKTNKKVEWNKRQDQLSFKFDTSYRRSTAASTRKPHKSTHKLLYFSSWQLLKSAV